MRLLKLSPAFFVIKAEGWFELPRKTGGSSARSG
jgi:hypothetical protein